MLNFKYEKNIIRIFGKEKKLLGKYCIIRSGIQYGGEWLNVQV